MKLRKRWKVISAQNYEGGAPIYPEGGHPPGGQASARRAGIRPEGGHLPGGRASARRAGIRPEGGHPPGGPDRGQRRQPRASQWMWMGPPSRRLTTRPGRGAFPHLLVAMLRHTAPQSPEGRLWNTTPPAKPPPTGNAGHGTL
jgi:hypothetical protein